LDDVEENFFSIANTTKVFVFVIFSDCSLMNEDIIVCVITIDETVTVANIEPFHNTTDSGYKNGFDGFVGGVTCSVFGVFFIVVNGLFSIDSSGSF
jgi:uncharacterized membrane protein